MSDTSALEKVLRHDRLIMAVGLAAAMALAWAYLAAGARIDMSMAGMEMEPMPWSAFDAALMFTMWWVMMIAMMVPSATPTVLLFTAIKRKQQAPASPAAEAWVFVSGVMNLVWVAGLALYVACEKLLPLDQRLSRAAGVVLIAAGAIVLARAI